MKLPIWLAASLLVVFTTAIGVDRGLVASLPASMSGGLVFVPVVVESASPQSFLLDSGLESTLVDRDEARRLAIGRGVGGTESVPGGSASIGSTRPVTVAFPNGPAIVRDAPIATIPLTGLGPVIGRRLPGIVGQDLFMRFVVEIDYAAARVRLYDPQRYRSPSGATPLVLRERANQSFIAATLVTADGRRVAAQLKVDTGSASGLGLNGSFVAAKRLVAPHERILREPGIALGGQTDNVAVRLRSFQLGRFRFNSPVATFSVDQTRAGDAGTIGAPFLSQFDVTFDERHGRLWLVPNAAYPRREAFDMSGLTIREFLDTHAFIVAGVLHDSPGARAGIIPGDVVTSIDGTPAAGMTIWNARSALSRPGDVRLGIRRRGLITEARLSLQPLI